MKAESAVAESKPCCGKLVIYSVAIAGLFLVAFLLVRAMKSYVPAPALTAARAAERAKALSEVRAAGKAELEGDYTIINKNNGVVRLPIAKAMELSIQMAKNPAEARKELLARVEKATAAPPKAPEKPSQFE